jgi:hypothetical protein
MTLTRRLKLGAAILLAAYALYGLVVIGQNSGIHRVVKRTFPSYCGPTIFRPECTTNLLLEEATIFDWPQLYLKTSVDTDYTYIPADLGLATLLAAALAVPLNKEKKNGRA